MDEYRALKHRLNIEDYTRIFPLIYLHSPYIASSSLTMISNLYLRSCFVTFTHLPDLYGPLGLYCTVPVAPREGSRLLHVASAFKPFCSSPSAVSLCQLLNLSELYIDGGCSRNVFSRGRQVCPRFRRMDWPIEAHQEHRWEMCVSSS